MYWFELTVTHNNRLLFTTSKESGMNEHMAKQLYMELVSKFKKADGYKVGVVRINGYGDQMTEQFEEEMKWVVDFDVHDKHGLVEGASFKKGFNCTPAAEAYLLEHNRMGAGLVVRKVNLIA